MNSPSNLAEILDIIPNNRSLGAKYIMLLSIRLSNVRYCVTSFDFTLWNVLLVLYYRYVYRYVCRYVWYV